MSKISYNEGQLQKALDRWMAASDDLAKFASTHKLAPEHVEFLQEATSTRTKELRRQLAVEHVESKVTLPSLKKSKSDDKDKSDDKSKSDDKPESDSKPQEDKPQSSTPSHAPGHQHAHQPGHRPGQ